MVVGNAGGVRDYSRACTTLSTVRANLENPENLENLENLENPENPENPENLENYFSRPAGSTTPP
jgi:hypothetical protein